jgi:transposase
MHVQIPQEEYIRLQEQQKKAAYYHEQYKAIHRQIEKYKQYKEQYYKSIQQIQAYQEQHTQLQQQIEEYKKQYHEAQKQLEHVKAEYEYLSQQYKVLQRMLFGPKREKVNKEDEEQLTLFNEAEALAETKPEKTIEVRSHRRKKGGKKRLPVDLPTEVIEYDVSEEEKECPCCGRKRPQIGQEQTEEIDVIPPKVQKRVYIRKKYGPCDCEAFFEEGHTEVITAQGAKRLLPGSQVSERTMAMVIASKYVDGIPLTRQVAMLQRYGIDVSKQTMSHWVLQVANKCQKLYELLWDEALTGPVVQMDETTVQVLHEEGRSPTSTSYMWVMIGYPQKDVPIIVYHYDQRRSSEVPLQLLKGYKGYVQTDGYAAYTKAIEETKCTAVGCFAHVRRKFYECDKLAPTQFSKEAIEHIDKLFAIDRRLRETVPEEDQFVTKRKEEALPVLERLYSLCIAHKNSVLPKSLAGEALEYCLGQWDKLIRYVDHAWLRPDNNAVERAIRPFVVGRKNWLFANTKRGAQASAVLYSLIQTAKANNKEPYHYLCTVFKRLPYAETKDDYIKLLPHRLLLD